MKFAYLWCVGIVVSLSALCAEPLKPSVLPEGLSLVGDNALAGFSLHTSPAAHSSASLESVTAEGPGFRQALKIATTQDTSPMDAIELRATSQLPVQRGGAAMLRFFARAIVASDETGIGRIYVVVRDSGIGASSTFEGDYSVGREWQEVLIPFTFAKDFPEKTVSIALRVGFKRQTLEVGGIDVRYYGKTLASSSLPRTRFTYAGREAGAAWREAALERIERLRQSDFVVRVTDPAGKPAAGVEVEAIETRSAFEWGTALQMARLMQDSPDNRTYRKIALELFNSASTENDLKWPVWLGEWEGSYSRAQTLAGLHWLQDHHFDARGHVLVWPGKRNLPAPIVELLGTPRQAEIPGMVEAHIREMAAATRGLVTEWDVLNEPYTNHDLMDVFGPSIMATWFKVAREAMPTTRLFFNDFSNHDATTDADHVAHFEKTVRRLLSEGAPVSGLGIQAHFGGRPNAPEHILATLDRYHSEFNLPIRVTEFDVWSYDEELQADFTRDFLILCYSHPSIVGVQFWGFWAGAHWRPAAALYREDWSERPAAKVYRDLVLHQWRTRVKAVTDSRGECHLRGYQGTYTVTATAAGRPASQSLTLDAGSLPATVALTLP